MDIDQASTFLVGSILLGIGCIILAATATVINNIFSRYWRPVNFTRVLPAAFSEHASARFATPEELSRIAPEFDRTPLDLSKTK